MRPLVVLLGPPAVGKMATGRALEELTGYPLFHNHMTIELVLPFFEYGSEPFSRLVSEFRSRIFAEVAGSELRGLIFTWVWAFDEPSDRAFIDELRDLYSKSGWHVVFVELWADLETRLARNRTELRLQEKVSKRDLDASEARLLEAEGRYRMNSDGDFPFEEHLWIDNIRIEPGQAARSIVEHFSLDRLGATAADRSRVSQDPMAQTTAHERGERGGRRDQRRTK